MNVDTTHSGPPLPSPLFGREEDVASARALLARHTTRALTLIGPPGVGKTRLALAILEQDEHGAFADLAPLVEPAQLLPQIARVLGISLDPKDDTLRSIASRLRGRRFLLVLDNFEHLLAARGVVADLLASCSDLKVLLTSRVALGVSWEQRLAVRPLPVPDLSAQPTTDSLLASPAVALFIERARAVRPDLRLDESTLRAVAELCARLDGLPLAIELAAARANALSPREILERLGPRLDMLQAGPADFPERHRSLRAAITWSYELLSPQERSLFRRLAVFTGGATLAAIEAVCGEQGAGVLDALAGLIDKSLVYRQDSRGETRFSMLDTVREYALERLREAGEEESAVAARTRYFLPLAEQAAPELRGPDQIRWLDRLTADHDNLRAVLRDAIARRDAEVALRLAGSLWQFWVTRGHVREGLEWLETALALEGGSEAFRAQALYAAGNLAYVRSQYARARQLHEAAMQAHEALGDGAGVARSMTSLGLTADAQGDYPTARRWHEKSLALHQQMGSEAGIASCLHNLALVALEQEQSELARQELEESLAIWQRIGNVGYEAVTLVELGRMHLHFGDLERADELVQRGLAINEHINAPERIAYCLIVLGTLAYHQGDLDRAAAALERSLALSRDIEYLGNAAYALQRLALVALERGDEEDARRFLVEALSTFRESGEADGVRSTLLVFAALLASAHPERSARLLGTVDAMGERLGASLLRVLQRVRDRVAAGLVGRLGEKAFGRLLAEGRSLSADDAIRLALDPGAVPEPGTAEVVAPAAVRVRLLGRFQLERDGCAIADNAWGRPQALALLQYLLLQRNRAVPVDELVEAFWPEAPSVEKTALYTRLSQLRRGLQQIGGTLRHERGGYRLDLPPETWVDIDAFEQALAAADRAAGSGNSEQPVTHLQEALSVYEGDLLAESPYSEWAALRRDALRQKFLEAALRLAAIHEQAGDAEKALALYRRVLLSEPSREEAHRGLMRVYARTGRGDLALRQYLECVEALRRDLDAAPSIETELLHNAIRERRTESPPLGP